MKKFLKISFWLLFSAALLLVMSFVSSKQSDRFISSDRVVVILEHQDNNHFLTESLVKERIKNHFGYNLDSVHLADIDLNSLEHFLIGQDEVKKVEVYRTVDGKLFMKATERKPIVRIIHSNGQSNYLDSEGEFMPLSNEYTAHTLIVNGHINESDYRNSIQDLSLSRELAPKMILDDVFKIAAFIYEDEFWKAQFQQIYVNEKKEFELIPRVGNHRIIFGSIKSMRRKFRKLRVFYKEGLSNTGWNAFKTINLKYRNQIVCK